MSPRDTDFNPAEFDQPAPWERCMQHVECSRCGKFHGYCSEIGAEAAREDVTNGDKRGKTNMPKLDRTKYGDGTGARFLKAADVKNGATFTIEKFDEVKTRIGIRPILRLVGSDSPFGLNATNLDTLVEKYGDDTDNWAKKRITLEKVKVNNPQTNKMQDGLRIA